MFRTRRKTYLPFVYNTYKPNRSKKCAARAELLFCESNLPPFWSHDILGYVHAMLSSIVWTPIRYVTLYLRDCRGVASLLFWNLDEIIVSVCEQKLYPVWFSCRRSWVIRYSVNIAVNSLKADFHCREIFTRVNKIEAMDGRSRVSVKVERGSAFTFTGGLSYIPSISFTHVNFTCIRTKKLRDSGNQPLWLFQNEVHENCKCATGFLFLFISDPGGSYLISFETILILLMVGDRIDYLLLIYIESKGGRIHNTTLFYYQYRHGELLSNVFECADILPSYIRDSSKSLPFGWWLNNQ